jgi:hypothetical protein
MTVAIYLHPDAGRYFARSAPTQTKPFSRMMRSRAY